MRLEKKGGSDRESEWEKGSGRGCRSGGGRVAERKVVRGGESGEERKVKNEEGRRGGVQRRGTQRQERKMK